VVAAGVIWGLAMPYGSMGVFIAGWAGGGPLVLALAAVAVAAVTALLAWIASFAPEASTLTGTTGGRVAWALVVFVLGALAWVFAFNVFAEGEPDLRRNTMMNLPLSGVPFVLAAGLLLRRWYVKLGALALVVASFLGMLAVLAGSGPSDTDVRLAAVHKDRGMFFVTEIPGFHHDRQLDWWMLLSDNPPSASVYVLTTTDTSVRCVSTEAEIVECTDERPDLRYERTTQDHAYYVQRGSARIKVRGTLGVDRDALRNAALTVRPATDAEITSMLPPARAGHGMVGRLKVLAARIFG
jgi:hypothetical protein